jgi:diguanylate cyclase (GGDEF)-like protein
MAKLLCIDDQADLRTDLADELRAANHIVFEAQNGVEGLDIIRRYRPDLVLCDVDMPEMDGHALLKEIRKDHSAFACMPFIFMTCHANPEDIIAGKSLGADDYLTKPVDFDLVIATVHSRLAQIARIETLRRDELSERDKAVKSAHATIQRITRYDAVTDLPNRTQLNSYLKTALARGKAEDRPVALFLLDLENFSAVTTRFSNGVADMTLKKVGERLTEIVAEDVPASSKWAPMVVSLGGVSFAILYPDFEDAGGLSVIAGKILDSFSKPFSVEQRGIFLDATLGYAVSPENGETESQLTRAGDVALQCAKAKGQGTVRAFSSTMDLEFQNRAELEHELRNALSGREFELHYQPLIDAHSGKVISIEALIRWRHPKRGLVSPADFVPIIEHMGLIVPMTEWVLETACRQAKAWQDDGLDGFQLAINLSPEHLKEPDFLETVTDIVAATGYDLKNLELEITESAIVAEGGAQIETLKSIRDAGITLAIDDFGTGYSSLAYLKRFPFDILKIDRAFVSAIEVDSRDLITVETIIKLGHCHGLLIIAEGVETEKQKSLLTQFGCDRLQGYWFSRPLTPSDFPKFINNFHGPLGNV